MAGEADVETGEGSGDLTLSVKRQRLGPYRAAAIADASVYADSRAQDERRLLLACTHGDVDVLCEDRTTVDVVAAAPQDYRAAALSSSATAGDLLARGDCQPAEAGTCCLRWLG